MSDKRPAGPVKPTTQSDAARVQSAVAKTTGGKVARGSYVSRMQAAAVRNSGKARTK